MPLAADVVVRRGDFALRATLEAADGETVAVLGPNGAGKTTLVEALAGLTPQPVRDPIGVAALRAVLKPLAALARAEERPFIARWNLAREPSETALGMPDEAWQELLAIDATARADRLSGGQRQRVGIARALMQEPDLLLADEPTSSLDPKTSVEIMELIARRAGESSIPAIVNIHNVELARRYADRIIGMSKGAIVFDGPPRQLEDTHLLAIYGGEGWLE